MRNAKRQRSGLLILGLSAILAAAAEPKTDQPKPAPAKSVTCYVPAGAAVRNNEGNEAGFRGDLLLKKGAKVHLVGGEGVCFVEAGAEVSSTGGAWAIVVKKDGVVGTLTGGRIRIYSANNSGIPQQRAGSFALEKFEEITFAPFQSFKLQGTVRDAREGTRAGIKVRAYGLDEKLLVETTTDDKGAFTLAPPKQVRHVVAELGTVWRKDPSLRKSMDLEFLQRVHALRGWEAEIRAGFWGRDATIAMVHEPSDALALPAPIRLRSHELPIQALTFSADGALLATVSLAEQPCLWDVRTGKQLRKIAPLRSTPWTMMRALHSRQDSPTMLVLDPHGKTLAFASGEIDFGLWESASGEQLRELIGHKGRVGKSSVTCAVFSPDGRTLASGGVDGTIRLWETSTGKTLNVVTAHKDGVTALAFSPDGRAIVSTGIVVGGNRNIAVERTDSVRAWDVATGRTLRTFPGESTGLLFSADGKRVAGLGFTMKFEMLPNGFRSGPEYQIVVWDFESGRQRMKVLGKADAAAFTPDGLLLLTATGESLRVWEVDTGQEILTCPLPRKDASKVAFSSDGAMLAVGQQDGAVDLWSVRAHHLFVPADKPYNDVAWEQLWGDLASHKAATAYRALWTLLREPSRAVTLLRKRLHPIAKKELPLDKWIAGLDSDDFNARQQAFRSLRESGAIAEHALRKARAGKPSLEARKGIDRLLEALSQRRPSVDQLRSLRAVQLLEEIGSPEARQILEALAKGWSEDRQTREAKAALARAAAIGGQRGRSRASGETR